MNNRTIIAPHGCACLDCHCLGSIRSLCAAKKRSRIRSLRRTRPSPHLSTHCAKTTSRLSNSCSARAPTNCSTPATQSRTRPIVPIFSPTTMPNTRWRQTATPSDPAHRPERLADADPARQARRQWYLDGAAGADEIIYRRVGANELGAIDVCRGYVAAQYGIRVRRSRWRPCRHLRFEVLSDAGLHNGLYWATATDEPPSPAGPFVADAAAEGYRSSSTETRQPYHGYYYRMLYAQGPNANGGAREYFKNGVLTEGFALVRLAGGLRLVQRGTNLYRQSGWRRLPEGPGRRHRYGGRSDQVVRPGHFVDGDHPDDRLSGAHPDFADLSVGVGGSWMTCWPHRRTAPRSKSSGMPPPRRCGRPCRWSRWTTCRAMS